MEINQKEYHDLILAAWLHDIGKFFQRAGFNLDTYGDENAKTLLAKKHGIGPQAKYTHLHAIFSDKFFREYLSNFSNAGTLAALHHSPENAGTERMRYLAKLITLADWMASGERQKRESEDDSAGYKAEPLISIFSRLKVEDCSQEKKEQLAPYYIPLVHLESSLENIFPVASKSEAFTSVDGQLSYKNLWDKFIEELKLLDHKNILDQIYYILEKFTFTIPATTVEKPDISLFHHVKSTAAITACLYHLGVEESNIDALFEEIKILFKEKNKRGNILNELSNLKREDFLLIAGDISGIQDFIYSVTSEKALKGLRGRSYYLQLISEIISKVILDIFNLPTANLLYCGGGHFFILLPYKEAISEKLKELREKIDSIILKAHHGRLAFILDWVLLSYADFFIKFCSIWAEVSIKLGEKKKKRFASLFVSPKLEEYWSDIMGPFDEGGEKRACSICGEELKKEKEEFCSLCSSFASLSDDLSRAKGICIEKVKPKPLSELKGELTWKDIVLALGFDCKFWRREKEEEKKEEIQRYHSNYFLFNSTDFAGRCVGYKFIANRITGPDGDTLTLENIARAAEGIKKWGVLRADIDNLGLFFEKGFRGDKTISRVSMLSSILSLYFGARLNYLHLLKGIKGNEELKNGLNNIYIAYSGGDDLFLIGPWSILPLLAEKIYEDFRQFTCNKLALSAGIYLAPSKKFPIYRAAREAGSAEEQAKRDGRNRISFLEKSIEWDKLNEIEEMAYKIKRLITERPEKIECGEKKHSQPVSRALLSILYDAYLERELREKNEIPMERLWRLFYVFKRIMSKHKDDDEKIKELESLLNKKIIVDYEIYPELNIAVRWAEYLTRLERE